MSLARRGLRNMDKGNERVEDAEELRLLRRQALSINLQGLAFGVVATAVALTFPVHLVR